MSNLELNKGDNFIFGIDVSASMTSTDCPGNMSRIEYLKEKVSTFVHEAAKYDEDGIDIITFGHSIQHLGAVTPANGEALIKKLQANEASTDTEALISTAYKLHKDAGKEQTVLFVATDGSPSDKEGVKKVIRNIAQDIKDEHEFAISFLIVGKPDSSLQAFLTELDDDLKAKHDIVDVKNLDEVDFVTAFVGALHD